METLIIAQLLKCGQFWHEDCNLTRVICNACGNWSWDNFENIKHTPTCVVEKAYRIIEDSP